MENILLDERGKSLAALAWGHPSCGDALSAGTSMGPHAVSRPAGHLKLTDFGLSRHLRWGERAHTICGTLQYMGKGAVGGCGGGPGRPPPGTHPLTPAAPEVLSGGPYSHVADWWSLGVLLFALASGEVRITRLGGWQGHLMEPLNPVPALPVPRGASGGPRGHAGAHQAEQL